MSKQKRVAIGEREITPHDPGTPDGGVPEVRRQGRRIRRAGGVLGDCPYPCSDDRRVAWMLGFEDVRLERWFR